jgi:AcrR family transcriptional regulator
MIEPPARLRKTTDDVGHDSTRQRLLEAAEVIFAEKGFKHANVREICQRAGANIAAVNYHFGGKEQLYVETVRHAYQSLSEGAPMPVWPAETPAETRFRDFIRTFLKQLLRNPASSSPAMLIMREVTDPTGACREFVEGHVRPLHLTLHGILDGLVPSQVSMHERNLLTGSIIGQCLHYHHSRWIMPMLVGPEEAARMDVDLLAEHIFRFSLAALHNLYPEGKGAR